MPISERGIREAMARRVSCICATCERYWEARDRGIPNDQCMSAGECGSPIAGDSFSQYKGPMTQFDRWCFVCAAEAEFGVKPIDHSRVVGVCRDHIRLIDDLVPVGVDSSNRVVSVQSPKGVVLLKDIPKKKTLGEVIRETEKTWAEGGK